MTGIEQLGKPPFERDYVPAHYRYFALPKRPGVADPDQLLDIALELSQVERRPPHLRYLAGSALCETVVNRGLRHNYSDYSDTLALLSLADNLFLEASQEYQYRLTRGKGVVTNILRCEEQRLFIGDYSTMDRHFSGLYSDIYNNHITDQTRDTLWRKLQSHLTTTLHARQYIESRRENLDMDGYVKNLLSTMILNYPYDNESITMPAFPHADSGILGDAHLTHDSIRFLLTRHSEPTNPITIEVKSMVEEEDFERYGDHSLLVDVRQALDLDKAGAFDLVTTALTHPDEGDNAGLISQWRDNILAGAKRRPRRQGLLAS